MVGLHFLCPTCQEKLSVESIVRDDMDFVYLLGTCETCGERYRFTIDSLLTELYKNNPPTKRHIH